MMQHSIQAVKTAHQQTKAHTKHADIHNAVHAELKAADGGCLD